MTVLTYELTAPLSGVSMTVLTLPKDPFMKYTIPVLTLLNMTWNPKVCQLTISFLASVLALYEIFGFPALEFHKHLTKDLPTLIFLKQPDVHFRYGNRTPLQHKQIINYLKNGHAGKNRKQK